MKMFYIKNLFIFSFVFPLRFFRSFQEFQELHWKLSYRFSSRVIPPLSHTVNVGRTNIRAVAARRQVELQYFLQRLFALSDEVAHSDLIYTFMHPLYRDTEPESRKINGLLGMTYWGVL